MVGGDRVLVNVASDEYMAAMDVAAVKAAGVRVVKIDFWQGGKKAPTVHLKHGRGLVARYVFMNDCDSLDALKGFDLEGYEYDGAHSSDSVWCFRVSRRLRRPRRPGKRSRCPVYKRRLNSGLGPGRPGRRSREKSPQRG